MKILVIDDSKFQSLAVRRSLSAAGHQVITAADGEEGLQAAREEQPDVVVLDMMLPKMSGLEVLRALRERQGERVPVIVLSGLSDKNSAKLIEEGAAGYIEKSAGLLQGNCRKLILAVQQIAGRQTPSPALCPSI